MTDTSKHLTPFTNDLVYISDLTPRKTLPENIKGNNGLSKNEREKIIHHLNAGKVCGYSSGFCTDYVTGKTDYTVTNDLYTDGVYFWSIDVLYHFKKYDYELKKEFIDFVLGKRV